MKCLLLPNSGTLVGVTGEMCGILGFVHIAYQAFWLRGISVHGSSYVENGLDIGSQRGPQETMLV